MFKHTLINVGVITVSLFLIYNLWLRSIAYNIERVGRAFDSKGLIVGEFADLVNVFIGTTGGGHVFPGATVPHGMVKAGMDTDSPGNHAGYDALPQYKATGFSQLHDDGTGGDIPLSNFKLWPLRDCDAFDACTTSLRGRAQYRALRADGTPDDAGSPGYFSTNLSTGVRVELTATRRTALHRYTFPALSDEERVNATGAERLLPKLLVDITNDGRKSGVQAQMSIDPVSGRVMGGAQFRASFGDGTYHAYTCVDFRGAGFDLGRPVEYGVYERSRITPNATHFTDAFGGERGALLSFPFYDPQTNTTSTTPSSSTSQSSGSAPTTILARVGVSLVSAKQACQNAEEEIPDFDFTRVWREARGQWNELLARFRLQSEDHHKVSLFYSSLYRTHIVPADYSGENPLWISDAPYFDSLYCNWDTYRTLYPLMSLHDPVTYANVVRSFIDIQQHEGWLPECRGSTVQQHIQGGTSGDPILAEFFIKFQDYAKELEVDAEELYMALVVDAEVEGPDWGLAGRQAEFWKHFGYIPTGIHGPGGMNTRQVSRTLEYAFDDFTISQVAKSLRKPLDGYKYANRSLGYEHLWDYETVILDASERTVEGIQGFMQMKHANGSFVYTDPRRCTANDPGHHTCYFDGINRDGFYEGGSIVYSQYVPHDTARLIELQGGNEAFIRRLDFIFDNDYFDSTNEPSQQIPFMYHYANRPGLSTERSRQAIAQSYNLSVNGLPGNDDSGAMGSYVAFTLLGLYPLPATKQFLISSPYFPKVSIYNPVFDTTTTIVAHGFQEEFGDTGFGNGTENIYVKSIKIDGKPWKSVCYVEWAAFEKGALIELELTNNRTLPCGETPDALPPSLSTGGYDYGL